MLAINSAKYRVPVQSKNEHGSTIWKLFRKDSSSSDYIIAHTFNYTWLDPCTDGKLRATFHYEGDRVTPNPRTLRVYGAKALKDVVLKLATNVDYEDKVDWDAMFTDNDAPINTNFHNFIKD